MKKKLLVLLLLTAFGLVGCGSKSNEEVDNITDEIVVGSDGDILNSTTAPTEAPTEVPEDDVKEDATNETATDDSAASDETTGGDTSAEEQAPYILTFEANTIEGEEWNSDKLADSKLTMINVWATYCNPCLVEMPDLGEIASEYDAADFQIIGIISDVMEGDGTDTVDYAKELIAETKADYPHLPTNESLYWNLLGPGNVSAVPTSFFVAQNGEVLGYVMGAQTKDTWKAIIDQLLAELE